MMEASLQFAAEPQRKCPETYNVRLDQTAEQ
jgi:hypothetical protein